MSKLLIEQLTEEVEMTKTAEEAEMEKIAQITNVVDQAQTLSLVGEELYKIAEELENEDFAALAVDVYQTGERMGSCLTKTASDSPAALEEAMEIAEDLNKLASVIAEIADDVQDEDFNKLAEAVIGISNELTDEANEVFEALEEQEEFDKEAAATLHGKGHLTAFKNLLTRKAPKAAAAAAEAAGKAKDVLTGKDVKHHYGVAGMKYWADNEGKGPSVGKKIKEVLSQKEGRAAVAKTGGAYAGLAAAGYGAKKHHDK